MDTAISLKLHGANSLPTKIVWGQSATMQSLFEMTKRVAATAKPALITGPTGSGKEVVAQLVHSFSPNAKSPFVAINCAAIPETLFESELFGYEKGAFTGATQPREGYMGAVKDGTIFFDEIGDLPLNLQTKILRVLETNCYTPVGSTKPKKMRGRVISASHKDLKKMVKDSLFREDLFYRLNVFALHVPSLSQRRNDIPLLVEHLAKDQSRKLRFTREAMRILSCANWPGNIRQLRNIIDRIAVLTDDDPVTEKTIKCFIGNGTLPKEDVLESAVEGLLGLEIDNVMVSVEYKMIDQALQKNGGNKSKAARALGIHRKSIERRILALDTNWAKIDKSYIEGGRKMADSDCRAASIAFKATLHNISKVPNSPQMDQLKLEVLIRLSICLRTVDGWKNQELLDLYHKALRIAQRLNKNDSLAAVYFGLWTNHLINLELDKALHFAKEYLKQGEELNSQQIIVSAQISIANSAMWLGDTKLCSISLRHFIERYRFEKETLRDQGLDLYVYYLMFHGVLCFQTGEFSDVKQAVAELETLGKDSGHSFTATIALLTCAWIAYLFEDVEGSLDYAEQGIAIAKENSFPFYHGFGLIFQGYALARLGQLETGVSMILDGYDQKMLPNGGKLFHSVVSQMLGELYCSADSYDQGIEYINTGIEVAKKHQEVFYLPELLVIRSRYHLLEKNKKAAEIDLKASLSSAQEMDSLMGELKATNLLAELWVKEGKTNKAYRLLSKVVAQFNNEDVGHNELVKAHKIVSEVEM